MLLALGAFSFSSCSDDDDYTVATGNIVTLVETGDVAVTATSATATGRVLDLSQMVVSSYQVGVVYGTNPDPATAGKKQVGGIDADGNVTTTINELVKGTTYYYATFVTLQNTVNYYGEVRSFVATDAQIATAGATAVSATKATLGGQANVDVSLINPAEGAVEYGIRLAREADKVTSGVDFPLAASNSNSFTVDVDGLLPGQTYYYVAYFKLADGYVYGDVNSFTTATQELEYVDLGLSVLWAKWNLGAQAESERGALIGWADLSGLKQSEYLTDYQPAASIAGTENDIALAISAGIDGEAVNKSQLPTKEQVEELLANTTVEQAEVNGVSGYRFTGKNGNSIFLPAAGYRKGSDVAGEGVLTTYWTGEISDINDEYGRTLNVDNGSPVVGMSQRSVGLPIRTVRKADPAASATVDLSKLVVGDLEGNGRIRIEIYNEYGSTKQNPPINTNNIHFERNMFVKFQLSGVSGNLVDGAPESFVAGLEYAADGWYPSLWSDFNNKCDALVNGDGEYTVWMETDGAEANGAVVFCIDIDQLGANLVDPSKVKVENLVILYDVEESNYLYYLDGSKALFNNKDGNGTDGRIEIYNEYGDTKGNVDVSDLAFDGYIAVNFTITGLDGNLNTSSAEFPTELSFADADWYPSWWGTGDHRGHGSTIVTGDGTYEVFAPLAGYSEGAVVWTIELYGLWSALVNPDNVAVTINKVYVPGKKSN